MSANPPQPDLISSQGSAQGGSPNLGPELPSHSIVGRHAEAESEDGRSVERLHVDTYISQLRPPACRRRRDQVLLCVPSSGNRVCRRTIPVLTSERIQLLFECEERNLRRVMDVPRGLHFFNPTVARQKTQIKFVELNWIFLVTAHSISISGEFPSSPFLTFPPVLASPRSCCPALVLPPPGCFYEPPPALSLSSPPGPFCLIWRGPSLPWWPAVLPDPSPSVSVCRWIR